MSRAKSKIQAEIDRKYAFASAVAEVMRLLGARCVREQSPRPKPTGKFVRFQGKSTRELDGTVDGGAWELDVGDNVLTVSPYDAWIACRFKDDPTGLVRAAALRANPSLNPHSGKWNWHFDAESVGLCVALDFGRALASLFPVERAANLIEKVEGLR